jgi:hypothetical protein
MARVEINPFETIPSTTQPGRKPRRSLLHYAIAASVAAAVCAGAIWTMQATERRALVLAQAQALPLIDDAAEPPPEEPRVVVSRIQPDETPIDPPEEKATVTELAPTPRQVVEPPRTVLGAPPLPPFKLETVLVRLPMVASMKDLKDSNVKKQLTMELSRGPQARVDLFCSDPLKAAEVLIATGRAVGVNVMLEANAQDRLRRRTPTTWFVYTESLTPEEATKWFAKLAANDSIFQSLHVPVLAAQDQKDLKDLLGVETKKLASNAAKPVTADTINQLSMSLQKDKSAILVSYLPPSARVNPSQSKDVKLWLDRRGEKKPGAVGLLIVVR